MDHSCGDLAVVLNAVSRWGVLGRQSTVRSSGWDSRRYSIPTDGGWVGASYFHAVVPFSIVRRDGIDRLLFGAVDAHGFVSTAIPRGSSRLVSTCVAGADERFRGLKVSANVERGRTGSLNHRARLFFACPFDSAGAGYCDRHRHGRLGLVSDGILCASKRRLIQDGSFCCRIVSTSG